MIELDTIEVMGMKVFNDDLEKISFNDKTLVNTISPNSYGISTRDIEFKKALQNSDVLALDGEYFGLAAYFLKRKKIRKYQGLDVFRCFMKKTNEISGRVFFLGSTERTLALIKKQAEIEYPNVQIETYSPPYKDEFSGDDNEKMVQAINNFEPHLLCVGMTAPKQEKWAYRFYKELKINVVITIGQVFDWFAGTIKEPHPLWSRLHLLWLIRTIKRPEILKRYPMVFKFAWHLFLNILKMRRD
jgi:N-acetylglucosaminyldiphosphoundecaprenol N-acetyl-beta-D-mannosaminyltransferase